MFEVLFLHGTFAVTHNDTNLITKLMQWHCFSRTGCSFVCCPVSMKWPYPKLRDVDERCERLSFPATNTMTLDRAGAWTA